MASKQILYVTNATEAEVALIKIMQHQDQLRKRRNDFIAKAKKAELDQQYQFYTCQAQIADNKLVTVNKAIELITDFLPIPANFPL